MVPTPQNTPVDKSIQNQSQPMARPLTGEEVVISGMSGIYPSSDSTLEFMENLYNKVDMVTDKDPRWIFNHPEVPKHLGKVNGMGKFDAQFFRVHYKQACTMEPMSRKLLEHAYAAIFDSGVNPLQLKNKVGVFIGSTFSESEKIVIYENIQRNGFGITGSNKAMYANRISYWIDGKGPSYALDVACASSMACLEHAYRSISTGQCDAAIVGGCNLCMHPNVSLNLKRAGFLCLDGKTKCFDKHGDGYVRSDAISVLFLQKAKDAKRIYSQIYHAEGNYSLRADAEFLPLRKSKDIQEFLENFYSNINVSPSDVEYVEAYGAGIAESDGNELEAIGKVFGKEKPIKVGCVKSNMGHSEPASGVCAITKVCLAYHKGEIPANLHYNEPQDNVSSVREGKIEVLTEHAYFNRGLTALNNFSYSGANIHVLLSGRYTPKDLDRYKSRIPHIVLASGRQESCVNKILNTLKSQPVDPEQIGLLHNIHEFDIAGHLCRGFTILDTNDNRETVCLSQKADYFSGMSHPVWFVYSGMGSQWAGMGADLMRIPTFAAAIQKCHNVLQPKGIDIVRILTEPDKKIYDNILNSFVGIAAVQIGLTDILKEMGIVPDNIIGHSVGELGCAYADGCFTAEEMILAAYSRGLVSIQTPFVRGSMAAVGLGYKAVLALCPPEIEVACHNSFESSTISGPADIMKTFVAELTRRGIFAKEVPCSNIAYHSRYIADAGPGLLKYLSDVIKNPKARSEKWVSSSVPQEKWDEPAAKYSSALYHTNNLLNSVLFEETAKLIPENALLIEIAPHGLLQAILKRSHSACVNIPLTRRGHANPVQFFLESIGKIYQEGLNPKVASLYPTIQYPVATETPLLSHLVEWEHREDWPQAKYNTKDRVTTAAREFVISIHDDDYKYLEGHVREEAIVFPEASLLVLIWETLAMHRGVDFRNLTVVFHDIQFHGEAIIKAEEPLRLGIMIQKGNYKFEVEHDGIKIVTGTIVEIKGRNRVFRPLEEEHVEEDNVLLTSEDIYKIMQLRGYSYKNHFRSILSTNANRNKADIKWTGDWITFLDSLIQLNTFAENYDGVSTPKLIKKLTINTELQNIEVDTIEVKNDTKYLPARLSSVFGITRCGGVEIDNIVFNDKPKAEYEPNVLETGSFIPHFLTGDVDMETALLINLQIIADNILDKEIKVTGIEMKSTFTVVDAIKKVADKIPTSIFDVNSLQTESVAFENLGIISKSNVFVVGNLLQDEKKRKNLYNIVLNEEKFILTLEEDTQNINLKYEDFNVLTSMTVQRKKMMLLNKANVVQKQNVKYLPIVNDNKFSWIQRLQYELQTTKRVVLVSEKQSYCGLLGLVRKLIKEYGNKVGLVLVEDYLAPDFNPEQNIFKEQLEKKMIINVFKKGQWGGYYYLPTEKSFNHRDVSLSNTRPGDIDSLIWVEAAKSPDANNFIQVCFTGPSFRDAEKAVRRGKIGDSFGMDFSGFNYKGERVMGLISEGAISNTVNANVDLLWPVPDFWSLEDAATVPLPYLLAYYCLATRHPMRKNSIIFVHGGAGAFGQAIISVALALNCTIFTTVSDISKKKFLLQLFPELNEDNISCSLSDNYRDIVNINTNGKKCHVVINSLSGSLREAAMSCVGFNGNFNDLSDLDMTENNVFGMSFLLDKKNYRAVIFSNIFKPENSAQRKELQIMLSNGIANGTVRPISRVIYPPTDVIKAFRLLSSSKHRGRVLIRMTDPVTLSQGLNVKPRMTYSSNHTYIVVCDSNDVGIELADRLVRRGARKLIIHRRLSSLEGYIYTRAASWRMKNVSLKLSSENLQTEKGCENLINEGTKIGSVEGIFIVNSGSNREENKLDQEEFIKKFDDTALVVANLDLVSRNICPQLRHFVVLNGSSPNYADKIVVSICEKICITRNEFALPALLLRFDESDQYDLKSQVFNSLETSLRQNYNNVVCFNTKRQRRPDFLSKISRILGLTKIDEVSENLTLRDLCANEVSIEEVKSLLKKEHKLILQSQQVQIMSIASLKQLNDFKHHNSKFCSGLGAFYTFIDEDECMATEPMITMPTKLSNASEKEEELDPKATYLMLFPGFEGHHQMFTAICERLKLQAITFQLGPDLTLESIPQIAMNIMKFMKNRFELKSKFFLLGYSFGVNVALELAALMEKEGHIGKVYCLDSSPDALRVQLDAYVGSLTDAQLENTIVEHMYHLMTGNESKELKEDLNKLTQWTDKIEACVKRLRGLVNYSNQYKKSILETAYKRIKLARDYEPSFKLESELILMKGIAHPDAESLPEDYNLSKYTKRPVAVFNLESDHALAPYDCRVSNIVNRFFEPQVLEEFKKKNLCDTYLANPMKKW